MALQAGQVRQECEPLTNPGLDNLVLHLPLTDQPAHFRLLMLHIPETGPLLPQTLTAHLTPRESSPAAHVRLHKLAAGLAIGSSAARIEYCRVRGAFRVEGDAEETLLVSEEAPRFVFQKSLAEVLDATLEVSSRLEGIVASTLRSGVPWTMPTGTLLLEDI